jgi:hypothetical protein
MLQPWPPDDTKPPEPHRPPREDLQRALQGHPADSPGAARALPRSHRVGLPRRRGMGRSIESRRRRARTAAGRDVAGARRSSRNAEARRSGPRTQAPKRLGGFLRLSMIWPADNSRTVRWCRVAVSRPAAEACHLVDPCCPRRAGE